MGPSRWPMLACCSAFTSKPSSSESDIGTLAHEALSCLIKSQPFTGTLDAFVMGSVEWACEQIRLDFQNAIKAEQVFSETWVSNTSPGYSGTVDAHFYDGDTLHVYDFKSLSDGEHNYWPQLCGYAIPLMIQDVRKAVLHVLHGKARIHELREVSWNECADVAIHVYNQFRRDPKTMFACEWCSLCASQTTCPENMKRFEALVATASGPEFNVLDYRDPENLTDTSKAARLLAQVKEVKKWCDAIEERCKVLAESGPLVFEDVRFELKEKKGQTVIADIDRAFTLSGLSKEQFYAAISASFPKLVKVYAEAMGVKQVQADKDLRSALGDSIVQMPETKSLERVKK